MTWWCSPTTLYLPWRGWRRFVHFLIGQMDECCPLYFSLSQGGRLCGRVGQHCTLSNRHGEASHRKSHPFTGCSHHLATFQLGYCVLLSSKPRRLWSFLPFPDQRTCVNNHVGFDDNSEISELHEQRPHWPHCPSYTNTQVWSKQKLLSKISIFSGFTSWWLASHRWLPTKILPMCARQLFLMSWGDCCSQRIWW